MVGGCRNCITITVIKMVRFICNIAQVLVDVVISYSPHTGITEKKERKYIYMSKNGTEINE